MRCSHAILEFQNTPETETIQLGVEGCRTGCQPAAIKTCSAFVYFVLGQEMRAKKGTIVGRMHADVLNCVL